MHPIAQWQSATSRGTDVILILQVEIKPFYHNGTTSLGSTIADMIIM
jgi:hypothetical protein